MSINIEQLLNKSQNQEHSLACVKCVGKTSHKVLVSVDIRGTEDCIDWSMSWATDYQIVQCLGCKEISFRIESSNSEDFYQISHDEYLPSINETLYPSRIEGRKSLVDETHYLPSKVRNVYKETHSALSNNSPILAGIGLRALLETVCKEKNADGKNLFEKIDDLVEKRILTPAGAGILHKIRTLGNDAAHEVKPHSDKQLALAMDIIEHLLQDVYILPKQVAVEFEVEEVDAEE